jgi:hypothetical protein
MSPVMPLGTLPSNAPPPTGNVQRDFGVAEATAVCNGSPLLIGSGAQSLGISITPARRCYWVVKANILISSSGNWARVDFGIYVAPVADLDGQTVGCRAAHSTATGLGWQSLSLSAMFHVEAGVSYTAQVSNFIADPATSYHQARRHMNMFGYTIGEGLE